MLYFKDKVSPETILTDFLIQVSEDLPKSDEPISEEHEVLINILYDYFVENFEDSSIKESYINVLEGKSSKQNENLFEEIAEILLDESIGKMVGAVVNPVFHPLNTISKIRAKSTANKLQKKSDVYKAKANASTSKIAKAFYAGRAEKTAEKSAASMKKHDTLKAKGDTLAKKIDSSLPGKIINKTASVAKAPVAAAKAIVNAPKAIVKVPAKVATSVANKIGKAIS